MSNSFKRSDKTSHLIQQALARVIQTEIRDPRLPKFLTISRVVVAPDMSHAKVYITTLGGEEEGAQAVLVLKHAAKYLRTVLTKLIKLRIAPQLHFFYDHVQNDASQLSILISQLNVDELDESNESNEPNN